MICEKELRKELKRYPKLIRNAIKWNQLDIYWELKYTKLALEWVLEDDCECRKGIK